MKNADGFSQANEDELVLDRDEILEQLYNLTRQELRQVAWEALLMSDGPAHVEGEVFDDQIDIAGPYVVVRVRKDSFMVFLGGTEQQIMDLRGPKKKENKS